MQLSEFLKHSREAAGLSQGDVAKRLRYSSAQFISNWERGVSYPPLNTLKQLADLYKICPDELFMQILEFSVEHLKENMTKEYRSVVKKTRLRA